MVIDASRFFRCFPVSKSCVPEIQLMIVVNFRFIKCIFELNLDAFLFVYPLLYSVTV